MLKLLTNTAFAGLCTLALAAAGCADNNDSNTSAGKPVDAATAQLALTEMTTNVDTTVSGVHSDGTSDGKLDVSCAGGGAAAVDGHVNIVAVPTTVDVKLAIDYNGCTSNSGTIMAGNIDFSQTVQAGALPVRVQTIYQGDVTFTGKVEAQCTVDLNVLVDEAGKTLQVQGSFCGQDAANMNLQIMPRWAAKQ